MARNPLKRNPVLFTCVTLLRRAGAENIQHWHGGKHLKVRARCNGLPISTTVPCSPSDWRSGRNTIGDIKRQLRVALMMK